MNIKERTIIFAEDDPDDQFLIQEAMEQLHLSNPVCFVNDGEELLDFLSWNAAGHNQNPGLILLDINMPHKDGKQALAEIKASSTYGLVPVVMLTTLQTNDEIMDCYHIGAAGYITKPDSFYKLVENLRAVCTYWLETVSQPG